MSQPERAYAYHHPAGNYKMTADWYLGQLATLEVDQGSPVSKMSPMLARTGNISITLGRMDKLLFIHIFPHNGPNSTWSVQAELNQYFFTEYNILLFSGFGDHPRALHIWGRCCTTEQHPQHITIILVFISLTLLGSPPMCSYPFLVTLSKFAWFFKPYFIIPGGWLSFGCIMEEAFPFFLLIFWVWSTNQNCSSLHNIISPRQRDHHH